MTPWTLLRALLHPAVMGGIGLYGAGAVLWLLVLARMDLSKAYPFMAVGLCGTVLLGHLVFGEPLRLLRLAGVGTVVIGIALIARS